MRNHATSRALGRRRSAGILALGLLLGSAGCGGGTPPIAVDPAGAPRADGANWQRAMLDARESLDLAPEDPTALHRIAQLYAVVDSTAASLSFCERTLALDPDHLAALSLWSKLQFDAGHHEVAIDRLEAARARLGRLPDALHAGLALHYDAIGRYEESAREFDAVNTPTSSKVYHVLRSDDFLDAGALARAALDAEPKSAASHNNFGITRLYAGDPEGARTAFLDALELEPDHLGALYNLAIVDAFYFFDEAQARAWLQRYRLAGALDDPDGLIELLAGGDADPAVGEQARR